MMFCCLIQVDTEPEQIASGTDATGIWMYKRGRFGRQQDDPVTQRGGRLQRRGWRRLIALTEIYPTTPTSPLETSTTLNYGVVLLASTSTHSVLVHPNPSWICSAGDLFRFNTHLKCRCPRHQRRSYARQLSWSGRQEENVVSRRGEPL